MVICLGIEATAHTFSVGIANSEGKILANSRDMYKPEKGGIKPSEAGEHHSSLAAGLIESALKEAKLSAKDIDIVAFSQGPGIPQCLRIGAAVARALSLKLKKPLVGVNHAVAHVEIGKLATGCIDPLVLYVSGGNTQILACIEGSYRILGETQDIALGNCLDQFARELGIPHPGGPKIEELASKGKWIELPYVVKGMDVSFSGILAEAVRLLKNGAKKEDLAFSMQETCFSMLTEVTERALAHAGKKEILLVGGVAANKRFRKMLDIMAEERSAKTFLVPIEYATDCGANIAWTGLLVWKGSGETKLQESKINRFWRADEVNVTWL
ncbi:MAG: bifunctional N(6)-L-threonylcarbamoyladenine synthase/serine/threonine protein kinase [Candidatus Aenigmarchaeota archaeon]|nr:bifunctional N(6)-L-threonylcarbamoyladenine synthase/serine/threonine protein kinase [Candidatus Aenigmarchaeota archaeon]